MKHKVVLICLGALVAQGIFASVIYEEAFYIDGTVRTEGLELHGSGVGSTSSGTGIGASGYSWSVAATDGFVTRYTVPGAGTTGDGGMYYSQLSGAYSYATVNFSNFTGYDSYTLTAEANGLDCSPLRMGFGVDTAGSFSGESGDALYIQTLGGGVLNATVDVSLVYRHNGTTTVLETKSGVDTVNAANDTLTLLYDQVNNTLSAVFIDGATSTTSTFGTYVLGFTPTLSTVKYEIENEGSFGNSNFPRWESTSLNAVPEPSSVALMGVAVAALAVRRWTRSV